MKYLKMTFAVLLALSMTIQLQAQKRGKAEAAIDKLSIQGLKFRNIGPAIHTNIR